MTTTTFEFGYLFGGVENISFNDKIAAITQAHKQGYSYMWLNAGKRLTKAKERLNSGLSAGVLCK